MNTPRRTNRFLTACAQPRVWRRALLFGLPVGLLQAALNQGDHWWRHEVDALVLTKSILCPLISFSIALVSTAAAHAEKNSQHTSS